MDTKVAVPDESWQRSGLVIAACVEVHRMLGPGLLESAYERCLVRELWLRGMAVDQQVPVAIHYKGDSIECGYKIDLLIEETILVEIKAVEKLLPVHKAQVITYLQLSGVDVGLLVNFNAVTLRDGLRRLTRRAAAPPAPAGR
jgi:GxxExxY protein